MRPLGWVGLILIVAGVVTLAIGGVPYTKSRNTVEMGPLKVSAKETSTTPPALGIVALALGGVLMFVGRKRS
ncbi:MAG: DUF3185 domain-containing protein [Gemmatimonadota bacterium]|nr:DUF3185 domain-containing protein [Gemmatimonadota bacterium]